MWFACDIDDRLFERPTYNAILAVFETIICIGKSPMSMGMFEPSAFLAIFPYAFIASFPIFGLILVTKWVLDDKKKGRI